MLPSGQDAAEAFYRVIDAAYEKRSVALTSNLHPAGFDTIMPKTLTTAAVGDGGGDDLVGEDRRWMARTTVFM
jgi:DNA replication protein DnaC